jgi:hypothetical protein
MKTPDAFNFNSAKYRILQNYLNNEWSKQKEGLKDVEQWLIQKAKQNSALYIKLTEYFQHEYLSRRIELELQIQSLEDQLNYTDISEDIVQTILKTHVSMKPESSVLSNQPKMKTLSFNENLVLQKTYAKLLQAIQGHPKSKEFKTKLDNLYMVHDFDQLQAFLQCLKIGPQTFLIELERYTYEQTSLTKKSHILQQLVTIQAQTILVQFLKDCWDVQGDFYRKVQKYTQIIESLEGVKIQLEAVIVGLDICGAIPEEIIQQIPFDD